MALDLSISALLASIRRRGSFPVNATTGTLDADLLRYVNEELQQRLVGDLMRVREEYFVQTKDYSLSSTVTRYRIPARAIGNKVRAVYLVDASGSQTQPLPRTDPEHRHEWNGANDVAAYMLEGNDIVLVPGGMASYPTLRVKFFIRPAEVVASTTSATVSAVNLTTGVVTTSASHGLTTADTVDLLSASPGNEVLAFDLALTAASGSSLTFTASALPQTLAAGDKVTLADYSTVAQLPAEYHPVLAQRVVVRVLKALGKLEESADAQSELEDMEANALALISPRADANPRKVFNARGVLGPGRLRRLFLGGS